MATRKTWAPKVATIALGVLALCGLYAARLYSYLLFHALAETFSIVVACSIFMLVWNGREFIENNCLIVLGVAYLFVGATDLVHTLAFPGMGVFHDHGADLPTQLWVGARGLEAAALLVGPLMLRRSKRPGLWLACSGGVFALLLASIFWWDIFPTAYASGGLTPFKKGAEYVICGLLVVSGLILYRRRQHFETQVLHLLLASVGVTIAAELLFTMYTDPHGTANLLGHFFKIVSFYLIYKGVVQNGLVRPYSLLFRELSRRERQLQKAHTELEEHVQRRTEELRAEVAERRRMEQELRRANDLLESAFSSIHILIAYLDPQLNFVRVNQAYAEAHGHAADHFPGKNLFDLACGEAHRETFERAAHMAESYFAFEEHFEHGGEPLRGNDYWDWSLQPVRGEGGETEGLVLCMINATERRHAQQALRESEERFRRLVENAHDIIYCWRLEPQFSVDYISPASASVMGYGPEEFYATPSLALQIVHPGDRAKYRRILRDAGSAQGPYEVRLIARDGRTIWTEQTLVPVAEEPGHVVAVQGVARDITERKEDESRILAYQRQLRSLASEVLLAEERERRRIAADLHDGVGQTLAAARMRLAALSSAQQPDAEQELSALRDLIDSTIKDTRSLTFEISPPVLYELGLEPALEWLCEQVSKRYGMAVRFVAEKGGSQLSEDLRVVLFRAVREALANASKHADADRVVVTMRREDSALALTVADDGKGFDTSVLNEEHNAGYGLFHIRERLGHMGGLVRIDSRPGDGTMLLMRVPIAQPATQRSD